MKLIYFLTMTLCQSVFALPTSTDDPRDPRFVKRDDDPIDRYILDYRIFGATGCFEQNWGVGTITSSQLDECFVWSDGVKAANLTRIIDGCSFHVYTGSSCDGHSMDLAMGSQCGGNIFDETFSWVSYKATCP